MLGVAEKKFDVVLMNPPFGDCTPSAKATLFEAYGRERIDLGGCFISRFTEMLESGGRIGVLANRTLLFSATLDEWRSLYLQGTSAVADLGGGVLDALVETAAFTLGKERCESTAFFGALDVVEKDRYLQESVRSVQSGNAAPLRRLADFNALYGSPFAYWAPNSLIEQVARVPSAETAGAIARQGLATCDNFRFLRLADELPVDASDWVPLTKGGEYQPFWAEVPLRVKWGRDARELKSYIDELHGQWSRVIQSTNLYGTPGTTYSERTASSLSLRVLPRDSVFDKVGPFVGATTEEVSTRISLRLIGLSYTTPYRFLIETAVGLRLGTTSGAAARHYLPSMIQRLPWPDFTSEESLIVEHCTRDAVEAARELSATDEVSEFWHEPLSWNKFDSIAALATARLARWCALQSRIYAAAETLEEISWRTFGSMEKEFSALEDVVGRSVLRYPKRNIVTISLIAYRSEDFKLLEEKVTAERVAAHFESLIDAPVERYSLPQLRALNFVLHRPLSSSVTRSLALDAHGKCLGFALLGLEL